MNITALQLKTARELLQWSIRDLAVRSRVPQLALARFEEGGDDLTEGATIHVRWVLENAGIRFQGGEVGRPEPEFKKSSCTTNELNLNRRSVDR
jgi:transcriptional regulator with XRE-family HTH domain